MGRDRTSAGWRPHGHRCAVLPQRRASARHSDRLGAGGRPMSDDENRRSDLRGRVSEEYGTVSNCGASSRASSKSSVSRAKASVSKHPCTSPTTRSRPWRLSPIVRVAAGSIQRNQRGRPEPNLKRSTSLQRRRSPTTTAGSLLTTTNCPRRHGFSAAGCEFGEAAGKVMDRLVFAIRLFLSGRVGDLALSAGQSHCGMRICALQPCRTVTPLPPSRCSSGRQFDRKLPLGFARG